QLGAEWRDLAGTQAGVHQAVARRPFALRQEAAECGAGLGWHRQPQARGDTEAHCTVLLRLERQNVIAKHSVAAPCELDHQRALAGPGDRGKADAGITEARGSGVQAEVLRPGGEEPVEQDIVHIADDLHGGAWRALAPSQRLAQACRMPRKPAATARDQHVRPVAVALLQREFPAGENAREARGRLLRPAERDAPAEGVEGDDVVAGAVHLPAGVLTTAPDAASIRARNKLSFEDECVQAVRSCLHARHAPTLLPGPRTGARARAGTRSEE